ncbi:MAG TPA: hypothetical protein VIX37_06175, partial [Candidatus Sulfotelmatobacter sp.]
MWCWSSSAAIVRCPAADRAKFWLVYPDKADSPQAIRKYLQDYGYHLPALRDPEHVLVKLGHAQITPEVAVFDRDRQLIYVGCIDDWYVDLSRARPAPTTHELEDAMHAALAGKPVANSEVRGGCKLETNWTTQFTNMKGRCVCAPTIP